MTKQKKNKDGNGDQTTARGEAARPAVPPDHLPVRSFKLTEEMMNRFLINLANNGGIVSDAADCVEVCRVTLYNRRRVDEKFRYLWDVAVELGIEVLEDELKRRGLVGAERPIFHQGRIVGWVREKSDYCLGLVLKAHRPKYREGADVNVGIMLGDLANEYATLTREEKIAALSQKIKLIDAAGKIDAVVDGSRVGSGRRG